jgi:hypothetical protein
MEFDANRSFPFAPSTFVAVIVSGLLEWLACSVTGPIKAVRRKFMDRVFEILKLDGRLYLAIENRYWRPYFCDWRGLGRFSAGARTIARTAIRSPITSPG